LRGKKIVTYHKSWIYFAKRFGLEVPIEIEENPGIPPSARHRDRVIEVVQENKIDTIAVSSFYDRTAADYVADETGARVIMVAIDVGAKPGTETYFGLIDHLIQELKGP
jgi:ABC-type Zn uptake system ZnuABC Zn-binding protein ZnuA